MLQNIFHLLFCFVYSELQTEVLRQQKFEQKCESWMSFLQRMEDSLAVDVAGSYDGLRQQLCTHKVSNLISSLTDTTKHLNYTLIIIHMSLCFSAFRLSSPLVTRSFTQSSLMLFICCRKERWRAGKKIKQHPSAHLSPGCVKYVDTFEMN